MPRGGANPRGWFASIADAADRASVPRSSSECSKLKLCAEPIKVVEELVEESLQRALPKAIGSGGATALATLRAHSNASRGVAGTIDALKKSQVGYHGPNSRTRLSAS